MNIKCITIVHPRNDIKKYRKWSALFRLFGIFVCEKLEDDNVENAGETDLRISTNEYEEEEVAEAVFRNMTTDAQDLKAMADAEVIFFNKRLMEGSYAIEYFAVSGDEKIYADMKASYLRFEEAFHALHELIESKREVVSSDVRKYLLTAQANCMRRMNQLYTILWDASSNNLYEDGSLGVVFQKKYYRHEEMEEIVEKILSIDPQYYGAYVTMALFEMLDDYTKVDAMDHIVTAINMIGDKSYSSYLRYYLGRCYEYILIRPEKSFANYKKSYELYHGNYRAIFKLAVFAQREHKEDEAIEWLDKILAILGEKANTLMLQPIECAYLYKAYKNKGQIYLEQKKYEQCLEMMQKALDVYNNEENESKNGFYPFMFGENAGNYKEAARKKLEVWKVYANMAEAAAMLDRYDDYKKYSVKAENAKGSM